MKETATNQLMCADAVILVASLAAGILAAPAFMRMGLTLLGAFSGLIVIMLGLYVVEQATN